MSTNSNHVLILRQQNQSYNGTNSQMDQLSLALKKAGYIVHNTVSEKEYELVVLPTSEIFRLRSIFKKTKINKIKIWVLGFGALKEAWLNSTFNASIFFTLSKMIHLPLLSRRNLIFSDTEGAARDMGKKNVSICDVVPIAVTPTKKRATLSAVKNFIWIGRLSTDFKALSIERLMNDLNEYSAFNDFKSDLDLIGDGEAQDSLMHKARNLENINVNFLGGKKLSEIEELILNNKYTAAISMGTSALETAKYGLPTILVMPIRNQKHYKYKKVYRNLCDTIGYSAGEYPNSSYFQKNKQFTEVIYTIENIDEPNRARAYTKNHNMANNHQHFFNGGQINVYIKFLAFLFFVLRKAKWQIKKIYL